MVQIKFDKILGDIREQDGSSDLSDYYTKTEANALLNGKEDVLGFTPEDSVNKATDFTTVNNILYPTIQAVKTYADTLVNGLLDYRGGYDASGNTYPTTGGSGTAGVILKGDMFIISVAGTLGGVAVQIGDSIIASVDSPGQTSSNWNTLNSNISYVPEDIANKATTMSGNTASDTKYLSAKAIYDWGTGLFALDSNTVHKTGDETIGGLKTFTSNLTVDNGANDSQIIIPGTTITWNIGRVSGNTYLNISTSSTATRQVRFDNSSTGATILSVKSRVTIGTFTDNGTDTLQVNGSILFGTTLISYIDDGANGRTRIYSRRDVTTATASSFELYSNNGGTNVLRFNITGAATIISSVTNGEILRCTNTNNVLIGTTTDSSIKLNIVTTGTSEQIRLRNTGLANGQNISIGVGKADSSGQSTFFGHGITAGGVHYGLIETYGSGAPIAMQRSGGNVLIGTTTDNGTDRLQVSGNLSFTGTKSHWMGEVYMTNNVTATTISNTTDYFKVTGTTTIGNNMSFTDGGVSNRLTYTGTTTRMFHCAISFSFTTTSNNQEIEFAVFKNGTILSTSIQKMKTLTGGDIRSSAMHVVATLATNDYIEVFVKNTTSASNLTVSYLNFFAMNAN